MMLLTDALLSNIVGLLLQFSDVYSGVFLVLAY